MAKISLIILAIIFTVVSSNNENNNIVRIVNSGSTNTASYVIELQRNGLVQWTVVPRFRPIASTMPSSTSAQNTLRLPTQRANEIFQSIEQALPFTQYKPVFCAKSVSFGTSLHVTYNEQQTPDLNCPVTDERLISLSKSIHDLIGDLHIQTIG